MIRRTLRGEEVVLSATHSLAGRTFGLALALASGLLLYFYFQANPTDKIQITVALLFFPSLILLGLSLFRARLTVTRPFVEEHGLFRRRRIQLPEGTSVRKVGRSLELRSPSNEIVYRIDRSFNHGRRLELELRDILETVTAAKPDHRCPGTELRS